MRYAPFRELHTPRLLLRKLTMTDVPLYFSRLAGSTAVTQYMCWIPHRDMEESAASIQKALRRCEEGTGYRWGITLRDAEGIIGIIDLLGFDEDTGTCSFAYMLGTDFWGRGFGTEALCAVLGFAFHDMQMDAVIADHMAENTASGAVMKKAGMTFQKIIPEKYEKNGQLHDALQYRVTRGEWLDGSR